LLTSIQDDLRVFHATHFPHAPAPEYILHGVEPEAELAEEYYEEDDGLGYYPDGSKRTLTDEQIAMFRHSEIHAILRQRRLRRENGETSEDDKQAGTQQIPSSAVGGADQAPSGIEEPKKQQWATTSARTKAKTKRKREKYKPRRKELQKERGLPPRKKGRTGGNREDEESDEWDPWHQANGPDNQKEEALDLDY
jgi:hypothetical protein